ncbi:MAG: hypothetical protein ACO3JL_13640 [Myxococcota bacterium]
MHAEQAPSATSREGIPPLAFLALPVAVYLIGFLFLPRPTSTEADRALVDRGVLSDVLFLQRPSFDHELGVTLGKAVRLLGTDTTGGPLARGDTIEVSLFVEVLTELDRDWRMFLHIDAQSGGYRIHGDHLPLGGRYLSSLWRAGEFLNDRYTTSVPLDATPGTYDIWAGFYIGEERMSVSDASSGLHDGENRVRIGTIEIR